jgi:iron complex transport system substrate-binding protein
MIGGGVRAETVASQPETATATPEAKRILAIGGDVTEILYALGAEERIVAVDSTSQFPPEALRAKVNVGYMRALSPEGVLSVGPDLIIASDRAGPSETVKSLKAALPYVEISEGTSPDGVRAKILAVARAIGADDKGQRLADTVVAELVALDTQRARIQRARRALFILGVQSGRALVGGAGTSADAIMKLAGLDNAGGSVTGFKPVGEEALLAMQPDIIIAMRRADGPHATDDILMLAGLGATPAGAAHRLVIMDGLYLLGFGPRVASAAHDLMLQAYPELGAGHGGASR